MDNYRFIKTGLKIIFSFVISFVLTIFLSQNLFFLHTPKLNPLFLARIKERMINLFKGNTDKKLAEKSLSSFSTMIKISRGVYAKEDKELQTVYIRITDEAVWDDKIINVNGKKIMLRVLK